MTYPGHPARTRPEFQRVNPVIDPCDPCDPGKGGRLRKRGRGDVWGGTAGRLGEIPRVTRASRVKHRKQATNSQCMCVGSRPQPRSIQPRTRTHAPKYHDFAERHAETR
jgi:hypothetical protein